MSPEAKSKLWKRLPEWKHIHPCSSAKPGLNVDSSRSWAISTKTFMAPQAIEVNDYNFCSKTELFSGWTMYDRKQLEANIYNHSKWKAECKGDWQALVISSTKQEWEWWRRGDCLGFCETVLLQREGIEMCIYIPMRERPWGWGITGIKSRTTAGLFFWVTLFEMWLTTAVEPILWFLLPHILNFKFL